ncbi:MAG: H+-translocating transhydrogenase subunit beta, partial [Thermoleophilaceae bacterium]|nr:H+-translocating transhydrogenase subunit beta [Thermoleophilaceae bacterium]
MTAVPLATSFFQDHDFIQALYLVAVITFIIGLRGLAGPKTAPTGNKIAAGGMLIAIVATLLIPGVVPDGETVALIAGGIALGTVIGVPAARNVKMTAMPQMVALFNGVGGGAVALIAWAEYRRRFPGGGELWDQKAQIPSLFAAIIGSISFWGSNIAFGKLQEILPGRPIRLPGQQVVNGALALIATGSAVALAAGVHSEALFVLGILVTAAVLGNLLVLPIGGADMPVVISLLNAFTGTAVAMAGFVLQNATLTIAGALVGASGGILTKLMADAMNRSVLSIIAGGFGTGASGIAPVAAGGGNVKSIAIDDAALQLAYASKVIIVPGYGLAAAQAQHEVRELAELLEQRGVEVSYAIHPVAGR